MGCFLSRKSHSDLDDVEQFLELLRKEDKEFQKIFDKHKSSFLLEDIDFLPEKIYVNNTLNSLEDIFVQLKLYYYKKTGIDKKKTLTEIILILDKFYELKEKDFTEKEENREFESQVKNFINNKKFEMSLK